MSPQALSLACGMMTRVKAKMPKYQTIPRALCKGNLQVQLPQSLLAVSSSFSFFMTRKEKSNNHTRTLCLLERATRIFSGLRTASIKRETGSVPCLSRSCKALLRIVRRFFLPAFSSVTLCLPLKKSTLTGVPSQSF